jgi:hypothetical protein
MHHFEFAKRQRYMAVLYSAMFYGASMLFMVSLTDCFEWRYSLNELTENNDGGKRGAEDLMFFT